MASRSAVNSGSMISSKAIPDKVLNDYLSNFANTFDLMNTTRPEVIKEAGPEFFVRDKAEIKTGEAKNKVEAILKKFSTHVILHAAAYKHVPIVEHNLIEGLKNNLLGTFTLAKLALDKNVNNFVLFKSY